MGRRSTNTYVPAGGMNAEVYQYTIQKFDVTGSEAWYYALGICGEAGEAAEVVKKAIRKGVPVDVEKLKSELGDVLWYITRQASKHGLTLAEIMRANVEKLEKRVADGTHPMVAGGTRG